MTHLIDSWSVVAQALGWTVIHSIWQITLIFLVFKAFSWLYHRFNNIGYVCALAAMALASVWSTVTLMEEYRQIRAETFVEVPAENAPSEAAATMPTFTVTTPSLPPNETPFKELVLLWLEEYSALLGCIWLFIVAILSIRLSGGYWLAWRLRHRGTSTPETQFTEICRHWSDRLGIRRYVQLLESEYITEPLTLGFWKPVVLFPAGMLLQLSPEQVGVLLVHELAHVRRYDYLVNLLQLTLETIFFYHPLFWLLSGEARRRREYSCDDMVLRHTRHPLEYARTLTEIKLNPVHTLNPFAMTLLGKDQFSTRILRIAGIRAERSHRSSLLLLLLLLFSMATMLCLPAITKAADTGETLPLNSLTDIVNSIASQTERVASAKPSRKQPAPVTGKTDQPLEAPENTLQSPASDSMAPAGSVAIELNKMNVCYVGIDNPMQIAVTGVPASELIVRVKGDGEISGKNGQYIARFKQPGPAQVDVYRMQNGKETLLASKAYRIKRVPDPEPALCGMRGGQVALEDLIACKELSTLLVNFDFDAVCEVVGFEMTVISNGAKDAVTVFARSSEIPTLAQDILKGLTPGSSVFFDEVKVKCPGDGAPRVIGSMVFKVK